MLSANPNRYFLPGHVWRLTHRCDEREFLLRFARDRRRWEGWLFEKPGSASGYRLNYINRNMVHAGVVNHPEEWERYKNGRGKC